MNLSKRLSITVSLITWKLCSGTLRYDTDVEYRVLQAPFLNCTLRIPILYCMMNYWDLLMLPCPISAIN